MKILRIFIIAISCLMLNTLAVNAQNLATKINDKIIELQNQMDNSTNDNSNQILLDPFSLAELKGIDIPDGLTVSQQADHVFPEIMKKRVLTNPRLLNRLPTALKGRMGYATTTTNNNSVPSQGSNGNGAMKFKRNADGTFSPVSDNSNNTPSTTSSSTTKQPTTSSSTTKRPTGLRRTGKGGKLDIPNSASNSNSSIPSSSSSSNKQYGPAPAERPIYTAPPASVTAPDGNYQQAPVPDAAAIRNGDARVVVPNNSSAVPSSTTNGIKPTSQYGPAPALAPVPGSSSTSSNSNNIPNANTKNPKPATSSVPGSSSSSSNSNNVPKTNGKNPKSQYGPAPGTGNNNSNGNNNSGSGAGKSNNSGKAPAKPPRKPK